VIRARAIHRTEYLALTLVLVGAAIAAKDQLSWTFWLFLLAPDLFGLLPASLMGRAPARGYLPPRGVWLYNVWHTFTPPLLIGVVLALLVPFGSPWPLLAGSSTYPPIVFSASAFAATTEGRRSSSG